MYSAAIREEPARRVVGLAHTGPYQAVGPVFGKVGALVGAAGIWPEVEGMVMICLSDPGTTPEAEMQSFAGAVVVAGSGVPEGLEETTLPGGRHAVLELTGPYEGLGDAWGWLYGSWMQENGATPATAPCFEIYRNDPGETPPEALRTDLYAPLA